MGQWGEGLVAVINFACSQTLIESGYHKLVDFISIQGLPFWMLMDDHSVAQFEALIFRDRSLDKRLATFTRLLGEWVGDYHTVVSRM